MGKRSVNRSKDDSQDSLTESKCERGSVQGLLVSDNAHSADSASRSYGGQAVLIVSAAGLITEVRQAPDDGDARAPSALIDCPIDELWPGKPAGRLAAQVTRTLRSRQVESAEFSTASDDTHHDFVFVPQGRDKVMVIARDVSERKTEFNRMERLAYLDDTTKLPNRQFLLEELERCTDKLKLQEGRAAVLCFDVAGADGQNDSVDTRKNDEIFVELASRLTHELRGANAEGIDDYERYSVAARIERCQFGVILPVIDSGADAEGVAQRLIETLQQPIKLPHHEVRMTVRAGIALFPQDGADADTLYANAVAAMEDARNSAATPYKLHSGTVRLRALQRQDLELELRNALDNDEFSVEFLPIVAADTRLVKTVEALLRWPKNVFRPQSIQKVIAVAENTGLILPIGDWVLRKSCEALRQWRGNGCSNLGISVNMSVQEFSRPDLVARIARILEECSIEPRYLDIEITEYTLFRDAMKNYAMCRELKSLGVGIIIDDYGTGACSVAHVARSPVDAIKIDNSFVANAVTESNDRAACAAITAMAATLGKKIIAEGVETEEQAAILVEQGCSELQGYLFCKPTSVEGINDFVLAKVAQ